LNQRPEKGLGSNVGTAVVGSDEKVGILEGWVILGVAEAQVNLPNKQPDVLRLPSRSKAY